MPEILAEVVYVCKGVYKIQREDIGITLKDFLEEVDIPNQEVICEALTIYSETNLDFVDCILIARNHLLGETIATFDVKLKNKLK